MDAALASMIRRTLVRSPFAPYDLRTRPFYLDAFWQHFKGRGYTALQTSNATSLTSTVAQGANVLPVADATGYVVGMPIVIGNSGDLTGPKQTFSIESVSGNNLTVYPKVKAGGFASGVSVYPLWGNATHPLSAGAYLAYARFIADAKQRKSYRGFNRLGAVIGEMDTFYTDANSIANTPTGWESILPANLTSVLQITYGSTQQNPLARRTKAAFFTANAANAGFRTKASIPVTAGEALVLSGNFRTTSGHPTVSVVDKNAPSTVIATLTADLADYTMFAYGSLANLTTISFTVPIGVTDIEIRCLTDATGGGNLWWDSLSLYAARQNPTDDRYVIEDPGNRAIVVLGDSWVAGYFANLQTLLETRIGHSLRMVNAGVSGNTLTQMNARWATDVAPYNPMYVIMNDGANDLTNSFTQATMEADIDQFIANCRGIGAVPVIAGVPPIESVLSTANDRNDQVRARCDLVTV